MMYRLRLRNRLVQAAFTLVACMGCAARRLPAPPPPLPSRELALWTEMPSIGPESLALLPFTPERSRLQNGIGLTVVSRSGSQNTSIALWVPSLRDTSDGPVKMMIEALRAGTRFDGQVLVNPRLGGMPIEIETTPSGTTFRWSVVNRAMTQALRLLSAFLLAPAFEPAEVDVQRRVMLGRIATSSVNMGNALGVALAKVPGFERNPPKQDAAQLLELSADSLRRVHSCSMLPDGAELVVVGEPSLTKVFEHAELAFGSWRSPWPSDASCKWPKPIPSKYDDEDRQGLQRAELQVSFGNTTEAHVGIALPGPKIDSPDYLPFLLLADLLERRSVGAAERLRQAGNTYAISSTVSEAAWKRSALFLFGNLDRYAVQSGLQALLDDLAHLSSSLQESDLEIVKRRRRNRVVISTTSNAEIATALVAQLERGGDVAALPDLPNQIMRVGIEHCRKVAEHWFAKAHPSIIVLNAPSRFLRGLNVDANVQQVYVTVE